MALSKSKREQIKQKYSGLCAYTGKPLQDDWQVDHMESVFWHNYTGKENKDRDDNMIPTCRIINHYKRALTLEQFRDRITTLHQRLAKLPVNPVSPVSIRRKKYLLEVAELFGITKDKPFRGVFFFEQMLENQ
jgi:hypothetical protein